MKSPAVLKALAFLSLLSFIATIHTQEPPAKNYAQSLIEQALARYPEVATLAMHVTPPKSPDHVIIASNFGSIGKKADEDDLGVLKTSQPRMEVGKRGDRFSVELPLQDVS